MRIRNRSILFLAMPVVVFFWFFGWSLYWIASRKQNAKLVERKRQEDLTFDILTHEPQYAK
jgi:CHASE3 domain sensor protein